LTECDNTWPVVRDRRYCWHRADWSTSCPCRHRTAYEMGQGKAREVHRPSAQIWPQQNQSATCKLASAYNNTAQLSRPSKTNK